MLLIHRSPLFRLALALVAGLLLARAGVATLWLIGLLPLLGMLQMLRFFKPANQRKRGLLGLCWYLIFAGMGGLLWETRDKAPAFEETLLPHICQEQFLLVVFDGPVKHSRYGRQADATAVAIWQDSLWLKVEGRIRLRFQPADSLRFVSGDSLELKVYLRDYQVQSASYQAYLKRQGITTLGYVKTGRTLGESKSLSAKARRMQRFCSRQLSARIGGMEERRIARAMIVGDKEGLPPSLKQAFAAAGLSHVLAISGLHVGIVFLLLNLLVKPLERFPGGRFLGQVLILLTLLAYAFVSGAAPSVCRAVMMFGLMSLSNMLGRKSQVLNILGASALLQLLWEPAVVLELGFQLSYLAVSGIALLMPFFERFTRTGNPLLNILYGWIGVSLSATLFTAPLTISIFGTFPTYFLLANVLASVPVFVAVLLGCLALMLGWVPGLGSLLGWLTEQALFVLKKQVLWVANLPGAQMESLSLSEPGLPWLLLQVAGVLVLIALPGSLNLFREWWTRKKSAYQSGLIPNHH